MLKKHQNLLSNNPNAQSITKYGFLVWLDAQILILCVHCMEVPPSKYPSNNHTTFVSQNVATCPAARISTIAKWRC